MAYFGHQSSGVVRGGEWVKIHPPSWEKNGPNRKIIPNC